MEEKQEQLEKIRARLLQFLNDQRYEDFVSVLQGLTNFDVFDDSPLRTISGSYLKANDLRVVGDGKNVADCLYNLATILWDHDGGELESLHLFSLAAPGSSQARAALGESLHWFGADEQAVEWLRSATHDADTYSPWLMGLYGEALVNTGRPDQAAEPLQVGYDSYPEFGLPIARLLLTKGDDESALTILEEIVRAEVYGAAIVLGNLYSERDEAADAERAYLAGIASDDAHCAFNLGLLYRTLGRAKEAEDAFRRAAAMGDRTEPPRAD